MSARHFGRTRQTIDPNISDKYYDRCLEALIPELDNEGAHSSDELFTATIVLRLLEEMSVPLLGSDPYQHSLGTRAFLQSQATSPRTTSLWQAVAWAGLRQEIYVSLSLQRPPAINADNNLLDTHDDCSWANRVTSHCLDVLAFCFGKHGTELEVYTHLLDANQGWHDNCPSTYDPLAFGEPEDNSGFSWDIQFHMDWHGIPRSTCSRDPT